jgi:hypothetical protein
MFALEGLGYSLTFKDLSNTSVGSSLVFRPLNPELSVKQYLIWHKYQSFTPIAERFLNHIRKVFLTTPNGE